MKYPLNKDTAVIAKAVQRGFGLSVHDISFIPEGEAGWLYSCRDDNDNKFVIKISKKKKNSASAAYLALHDKGYAHMPQPIPTKRHTLWKRHWLYLYSLQQFIDIASGNDVFDIPAQYLPQLGKALRDLHETQLPQQLVTQLPKEAYVPAYYRKAQLVLKQARQGKLKRHPEIQQLLTEYYDALDALINRSLQYGQELRQQRMPLVPTHGDVHPFNILRSKSGNLYLADWELISMSHAEHDVMYFNDKQIGAMSTGYGRNLLENRTAIEYYRHHLRLREIHFFAMHLGVRGRTADDRWRGAKGLKDACETIVRQYG